MGTVSYTYVQEYSLIMIWQIDRVSVHAIIGVSIFTVINLMLLTLW